MKINLNEVLGIALCCLTDKLMVITYQFVRLNFMNNIFKIKFYKQCAAMHYLSLMHSPLPFQVLKVYVFCHVSHEKLVQWLTVGWVSFSHFLYAVAIKWPSFHAFPCSSCLDIVALKRVLLLGFFTFPIHRPCWLSLPMDLMGFLCIVATQGFITILLLLFYFMLLLCETCY